MPHRASDGKLISHTNNTKNISHLLLEYAVKRGNGIIITPEFPYFPFPHSSDPLLMCLPQVILHASSWSYWISSAGSLLPQPSAAQTARAAAFGSPHVGNSSSPLPLGAPAPASLIV